MAPIYINLIHENEQRSAALVTKQFLLIGIFAIAIGLVAAFGGTKLYRISQIRRLHGRTVQTLREVKKSEAEEKKRASLLSEAVAYAEELSFWSTSQPDWPTVFHAIAAIVPDNIQIERMNSHSGVSAEPGGKLTRQNKLELVCRVVADQPEPVVRAFHAEVTRLLNAQASPIQNFRPIPTADPSRKEFSFQISCVFNSGETR